MEPLLHSPLHSLRYPDNVPPPPAIPAHTTYRDRKETGGKAVLSLHQLGAGGELYAESEHLN